jgi:hypothetical protein
MFFLDWWVCFAAKRSFEVTQAQGKKEVLTLNYRKNSLISLIVPFIYFDINL